MSIIVSRLVLVVRIYASPASLSNYWFAFPLPKYVPATEMHFCILSGHLAQSVFSNLQLGIEFRG